LTNLPISPNPPASVVKSGVVILGRFQPFHKGHIHLIKEAELWRLENSPNSQLVIAIGSSNRPESMVNPWTYQEREEMINSWLLNQEGFEDVTIVAIPDIEDPPNWVSHAENYHGSGGFFFTSDQESAELYRESGWRVITSKLEKRENLEGWRVRATAHMLSTIGDEKAIHTVLSPSVSDYVIDYLIRINGLRRLAFLGQGGEPVG
jgi:cytidyltransferase-like protein